MRVRELLVLAAALGAVACEDNATEPDATVDEQVSYIKAIVPHHQIAIMRADEALAKANREGTRRVAERMKEDQSGEIEQFLAILEDIAPGETTPPPMTPEPIPAGPEFDEMFYRMMIPHHQGAIDVSNLAHGSNVRADLDSLVHHTIVEQQNEQEEFADSLMIIFGETP